MDDAKIASKAKAQLANFMGRVPAHFPKPRRRFAEECVYGIQASRDTRLSSIVRAIDDDIRPIHMEKRPIRNLDDEALKTVRDVYAATGGRDVVACGRGGDRPAFYEYFIGEGRDFIVRLKGRSVLSWGGTHEVHDLARQCVTRHFHHVAFDSHGRECSVRISFGAMPVRLPMHPGKALRLVVVRGFGQEPTMLPTSLPVDCSSKSGVHPLREGGAPGGGDPRRGRRTSDGPAAAWLRGTPRHGQRMTVSGAERRKPHPETHSALYPRGCGALPHSKNG